LLCDRFPVLFQTGAQFADLGHACRFPGGDGNIDRRQGLLVQAKGFSCQAFNAIARYGSAEDTRRDAQTQSRKGFMIGQHGKTKKCIGEFSAAPLHITKFRRLVQSLARLERQFMGSLWRARYGQRRLRPLARRRASNRRPLLVAMRARNPWVRARCKLLGLKVRFIARLEQKPRFKSTLWLIYERRQGY
jgi:hypothetical protein